MSERLKLSNVVDNFFVEYEGVNIKSDLATIWANDCAKKFVNVDGNTDLKAKIVNITGNRGNLGKEFYKIAQVWFNPWTHRHDKMNFLKHLEHEIVKNNSFKEKKILKGCNENKIEERCFLDLRNIPVNEYYKDPILNAIHSQLKFISEIGLNINSPVLTNKFSKFIYARPDLQHNSLMESAIPCIDNDKYVGNITYYTSTDNVHIYTNYPDGIILLLYYSIPLDEEGNVLVLDHPNVINAIYSYILWKNALKDIAIGNFQEAKVKVSLFQTEYLQNLRIAKNEIEKIDPAKFAAIYRDIMYKLLGRDIDYNPFRFDG